MKRTTFEDFTSPGSTDPELDDAIELIAMHSQALTETQASRLFRLIPLSTLAKQAGYSSDFDVTAEVSEQVLLVRAMRDHVQDPITKQIREGIPLRVARDVVSAANTQIATLIKHHSDIVNFDRLRRIEQTVVDVLGDLDPELKAQFMQKLEERLADK